MCAISLNLTGLDTETIIQQMMAIERQPLVKLQNQQIVLAKKKQAWDAIKSKLGGVSSRLSSLVNTATFARKTVTSTNSSVASATASSTATQGVYDLKISSLASNQVVASSLRDGPVDGALNITGNVTLCGKSISIGAADSLTSIAAKINATPDMGVRASVLQTEPSKFQLVLSAVGTGTANEMTFEGDIAVWESLGVLGEAGVNQIRAASDAVFSINGVQFTRPSNSVSDAISGLTLSLGGAADPVTGAGGTTVLTVGHDDQAVVECVKQFVVDYNTLIDTIKTYNSWNPDTRTAGTLFGDPLLQRLLSALRDSIFSQVQGGALGYQSMSAVGLSTGAPGAYSRDGKLSLDEAKLQEALKTNRDAVLTLFGAQAANVALGSAGSTVTVSSSYSADYSPESVIDGSASPLLWGSNGGWMDGTAGEFPDTLEIDFGTNRTIDRLNVFTLDSALYPAASYGIRDFSAEFWDNSTLTWMNLLSVTDNTQGYVSNSFSAVTTSKIRINVTGSNDGQFSRILEVEAFQKNDGVFRNLQDVVRTFESSDGLLLNRTTEIDRLDRDLTRQIESMQRRLDLRMASLKKKFTALEVMLQQFNSQSAWMTQQIQSMSKRENG